MGLGVVSRTFNFNNQADQLYLLTVEIIDHVVNCTSVNEHVLFKLKIVLVELLTNSLKHSGDSETNIEVTLFNDKITITKIDAGTSLTITNGDVHLRWPLSAKHINNIIPIYGDITCTLKVRILTVDKAVFFIEENDLIYSDTELIENLPEHFGLLIIARACDLFEYEFDAENNINHFTATLLLKD